MAWEVGSSTSTPVLPSSTSSAIPPLFIVITGTPKECVSSILRGQFSYHTEGKIISFAFTISETSSSPVRKPFISTLGMFFKHSSSGPFPATTKE